jgi:hypothetical protein
MEQGDPLRLARAIPSSSIRMMLRRLDDPVNSSSSASSSIRLYAAFSSKLRS